MVHVSIETLCTGLCTFLVMKVREFDCNLTLLNTQCSCDVLGNVSAMEILIPCIILWCRELDLLGIIPGRCSSDINNLEGESLPYIKDKAACCIFKGLKNGSGAS